VYIDELNQKFSTYNKKNETADNRRIILAQNRAKAPRKLSLRSVLVLSSLPLFGIYTAFGIAPQTVTSNFPTTEVVEEVALPSELFSNKIANTVFYYKEHVHRDDTVKSILTRLNIQNDEARAFISHNLLNNKLNIKLNAGQTFESSVDTLGNLNYLQYQFSDDQYLEVTKLNDESYHSRIISRPLNFVPVLKSAIITNSLFASTDKASIPDAIALQIIKIFESEIDFHQDLRKGDTLKVIYEAKFDEGSVVNAGNVLAVEFVNNQKVYRAVGFPDQNGEMAYYSTEGKSLNKSFLRSPLEFTRITSGFSLGRFHPVLQRMRAHKGVDMAAPTGTRIRASGDAKVEFIGVKGGYGNVIILKHDDGISTVYGHLSRFATNLKVGQTVEQGTIIGFVGQSGLATGPHLHYEFLIDGKHRDPMKVALPKNNIISASQKTQFMKTSNDLMSQIKLLNNTNIAALD
jgi:murein DD-endopeptidase MepM/ murein hydrolase activator NlpD